MMVGAVKRLISMMKKLPNFKTLPEPDQLKLVRSKSSPIDYENTVLTLKKERK